MGNKTELWTVDGKALPVQHGENDTLNKHYFALFACSDLRIWALLGEEPPRRSVPKAPVGSLCRKWCTRIVFEASRRRLTD
jgi:hypothetical protein